MSGRDGMTWYQRCVGLVAAAAGTRYVLAAPGRAAVTLDPVDVEGLSALLERVARPIPRTALVDDADEGVIEALVDAGILVECAAPAPDAERPRATKRCKTLVVGVCGAINAIHSFRFIADLVDRFADNVEVIVSEGARQFVVPEVFGYHGVRVWTDPFVAAHGVAVPHAHLATAADAVLVAPASANMVHKLATGACSDLISLVVAATPAPVIVAPSTNFQMWRHAAVQRNVAQLRADGIWVVDPGVGPKVARREQVGVGVMGFDSAGLMAALDVIVPPRSPDE